jgi:hypothetical protein
MVIKDKTDSYLILATFFLYLTIILFSIATYDYNFYIFITGIITLIIGINNLKKLTKKV